MHRVPDGPTAAPMLTVKASGERPAFYMTGASDHFFLGTEDYDEVCDARYLHVGGAGFLKKMDGPPTVSLLRAAKARGYITTFDLNAPGPETLGIVEHCLPYIDYVMPNMEEVLTLSGRRDPGAAARFILDREAGTACSDGAPTGFSWRRQANNSACRSTRSRWWTRPAAVTTTEPVSSLVSTRVGTSKRRRAWPMPRPGWSPPVSARTRGSSISSKPSR